MVTNKSLDEYELIAALATDIFLMHGSVFNTRAQRLTLQKIKRRLDSEGISFLTKTLPKLGKAFDKALSEDTPLNCVALGFKPKRGTKLPLLMGELFSRVLSEDGTVLPSPCIDSIKSIRQFLYLFYKYELPYSDEQEQQVIAKFERTEHELETSVDPRLRQLGDAVGNYITTHRRRSYKTLTTQEEVTREARILLSRLFASFDPTDILPRHGPGAVATKQRLWDKYLWTNISAKIARVYPMDAYFYASLGHICDHLDSFKRIDTQDLPARVILVPKDSRGPRLISCEPVDYQWVQQGLGQAIVRLVETKPLTKWSVFFTDQVPNRIAAIYGSGNGRYATLDLNEASDRVSLELVRLLFPPHIYAFLENCRSSSTRLPDGMIKPLHKFAPMGSSLCFPVLALCVWAILSAGVRGANARERIHVYGDDVIVPTAQAEDAIERLESFGLKVNRDKSCIKGFFRESCGMDAYKGSNVTPVRIRTVWSSKPSPDPYTSWIAYANSFWDARYYVTYDYIMGKLHAVYGAIPCTDMQLTCPSLRYVADDKRPKRHRVNHDLQKQEWLVRDVKSPPILKELDGWTMLLRYFVEGRSSHVKHPSGTITWAPIPVEEESEFSVRSYTRRGTSMLVRRWR